MANLMRHQVWRQAQWRGIVVAALMCVGQTVLAQTLETLPKRTIKIIAPAAPGGILDLTSRFIGER